MPVELDQDAFSRILSHIRDSRTIYTILRALPVPTEHSSNAARVFFLIALRRLCELPVYLDVYDGGAAGASNEVLDYLLKVSGDGEDDFGVAESIRHLVVAVEHKKYRMPPEPESGEGEGEGEDEDEEAGEGEEPDGEEAGEDEKQDGEAAGESEENGEQDADADADDGEMSEEGEVNDDDSMMTGESDSEDDEDIDVQAFHERLPALFERTRNLRSLDYRSCPGLGLSPGNLESLSACEGLKTIAVDACVRPTPWSGSSAYKDPEMWDLKPYLSTLGSKTTSLDLRHVSQSVLRSLLSYGDILATYGNLEFLKMDITEGVWDWNFMGSPQRGATEDYVFPSLRLPALRRLELVVADMTIAGSRAGPLDLVDRSQLTDLSLDVRRCIYIDISNIRLFAGMSPSEFPALTHLEIKDDNGDANKIRVQWDVDSDNDSDNDSDHQGRFFAGLVPQFLPSLPNLTSLWVDECVLLPGAAIDDSWAAHYKFCTVTELWDNSSTHYNETDKATWRAALREILGRLESLRVGFGLMDGVEVGLILDCCDPTKLREFGFAWYWKKYGRDEPISPKLLGHLSRFPKLTDIHILFPRPDTRLSGAPNPDVDPRATQDVAAIFESNGSISRVGIANSIVWERCVGDPGFVLVSDGSEMPNPALSRFYHAGYMTKYDPKNRTPWIHYDNNIPMRPRRGEEIGEMRDLLKRILK
ncbi:hypothetical protein R3P38DRAFT_3307831 [Favolaschia claudopus]|uniref:Uncharacterized protein n=1 Tax=Favolaschia claudopus TaxID=2862362 RepID=A0AAW0D4R7_9AGAR